MTFGRFFANRLWTAVLTLVIVSTLIFTLQRLLPGDPILAIAGDELDPAVLNDLRRKYQLDQPIFVQYFAWASRLFQGDLGMSLRNNMPVSQLLAMKLPITVQLAAMAMMFALAVGIPSGVLAATAHRNWRGSAANFAAIAGMSIPTFWLGILMIMLFSVQLGWLPSSGYVSPMEDLGRNLSTLLMPAVALGVGVAGVLGRHARGSMMTALSSDYIRTARAKGLPDRTVTYRHALRNAWIPVITLSMIEFGHLLAGAVITEQIFSIPGMGKLIVDAVLYRDYAVVQGIVLVAAAMYIGLNLLADLLYYVANPKMRG